MIVNGDAPCSKCSRYIYNIPVLTETKEACVGCAGHWYQVTPGGKCLDCGEYLGWIHIPAPEDLVLELPQMVEVKSDNFT